jgi:hypothetical protein
MSQYTDFVEKYNGQSVEVEDSSNPNQCFDLAFAWCDWVDIDRATIRHLNAYQIWTQPNDMTLQFFDYIPNTPNGIPKEGDIVVFSQAVGSAGHVSIASGVGDTKAFQSFDQNWSGVQYARMVNHAYASVLGWLHIKVAAQLDISVIQKAEWFGLVATKLNVAANKDIVMGELDKLIGYEDAVVKKDSQIKEQAAKITELEGKLATLDNANTQLKLHNDVIQNTVNEQQKLLNTQDTNITQLKTDIDTLKKQMIAPDTSGWKLIGMGLSKVFGLEKR